MKLIHNIETEDQVKKIGKSYGLTIDTALFNNSKDIKHFLNKEKSCIASWNYKTGDLVLFGNK